MKCSSFTFCASMEKWKLNQRRPNGDSERIHNLTDGELSKTSEVPTWKKPPFRQPAQSNYCFLPSRAVVVSLLYKESREFERSSSKFPDNKSSIGTERCTDGEEHESLRIVKIPSSWNSKISIVYALQQKTEVLGLLPLFRCPRRLISLCAFYR